MAITVIPAYRRDYTSQQTVLDDWDANKDFMINDINAGRDDGRYINKRDAAAYLPGITIRVKYNKLRDVLFIEPPAVAKSETFERATEDDVPWVIPGHHQRLEYLRGELRGERISWGELHELQSLAEYIDPGDTELLEAAGIPEGGGEPPFDQNHYMYHTPAGPNPPCVNCKWLNWYQGGE